MTTATEKAVEKLCTLELGALQPRLLLVAQLLGHLLVGLEHKGQARGGGIDAIGLRHDHVVEGGLRRLDLG